jgi:hypothetical protein
MRHVNSQETQRALGVVPVGPRSLMNASFPWNFLSWGGPMALTVDWPSQMYRHRTLDQTIRLFRVALDLAEPIERQRRAGQTLSLYVPGLGVQPKWFSSRVRLSFWIGAQEVCPSILGRLSRAWLVCASDESVSRIRLGETNLACDVALAACCNRDTRVRQIQPSNFAQDRGVTWNSTNVGNKMVVADGVRLESVEGET